MVPIQSASIYVTHHGQNDRHFEVLVQYVMGMTLNFGLL